MLNEYIKGNTPLIIPMYAHKGEPEDIGARYLQHHHLPPHRWMYFWYTNSKEEFFNRLVGSFAAIEGFGNSVDTTHGPKWDNLFDVPIAAPMLHQKDIPIILHGGGVPCSNQPIQATSFASLVIKM